MGFVKNIPTTATDQELIAAYRENGDAQHLSVLYQRYMDLVYGVCLKYFKDTERSKDAVMDIYEVLNVKLKQHEVANFKGWLHVLARNYCLMQLRSPRNLKTTEFNVAFMQSEEDAHQNSEQAIKEENLNKLEKCIGTLPEEQQRTIELFYLQDKCYKEIADTTGYGWDKVRSYIQNGKRNLKICMERENGAA